MAITCMSSLYDNDGVSLLGGTYTASTETLKVDGLENGTYFIKVFPYFNYQFAPYTISTQTTTYDFRNDLGGPYTKFTIAANSYETGHVGFYYNNQRDTSDTYKVNYTGTGNLNIVLEQEVHKIDNSLIYMYVFVYADTLQAPIYSNYYYGGGEIQLTGLAQQYYYIKVQPYYSSQFASYKLGVNFEQVNIASATITQAINGDCTTGQLKVQPSGSKPPYIMDLYRFNSYVTTKVSNSTQPYTFTDLQPGIYYVKIRGDGATGSAVGTSNNKSLLPPATSNTSETSITTTKATVRWNKVPCANGYVVQYKVSGTAAWTQVTVMGNKDSLKLINLTANTTYQWRVATAVGIDAVSNYVISAFTPVDMFTTAASLIAGNVTISPNPATSYFIIEMNNRSQNENVTAWLKDAAGHTFWTSGKTTTAGLHTTRVNVSNLKPGIYYLQVGNAFTMETQKVIVNR